MIHVCSLARLPGTVIATGARHVITVMGRIDQVKRPESIDPENHLMISMDDIAMPIEGFVAPCSAHVEHVLDFARRWDRASPLVIHCYAGISRSTASAFAAACALNPKRSEAEIAWKIREASPTASPNRLIVALADEILERRGRMVAALDEIGSGIEAVEAAPFRIDLS